MAVIFINGDWIAPDLAVVPLEDRGHQFGDGVYDVAAFFNRKMVDATMHVERLGRSLREIKVDNPYSPQQWLALMEQLIEWNDEVHGGVYIQVTRGAYSRDHLFPPIGTAPSVTMSIFKQKTPPDALIAQGCHTVTRPDLRWKRCDIKTINLLPNVLAKQFAKEAGAREVVFLKENGEVTEAAVANIFMVKKNALVTHPATNEILNGITRQIVITLAEKIGIVVEERAFTLKELFEEGEELFLTSTTSNILGVCQVDEQKIGDGKAGKTTLQLLNAYRDHIEEQTGFRP